MAYPLEREWVVWYSGRAEAGRGRPRGGPPLRGRLGPGRQGEETALRRIGGFRDIAGLWQYMNNIAPPSKLRQDLSLYIFLAGVEPRWEDPENSRGGRWTFSVNNPDMAMADDVWAVLYLTLVGETFTANDEITGIVATRRRDYARISVWTKNCADDRAVLRLGADLRAIAAGVALEYQDHGAPFGVNRHALG